MTRSKRALLLAALLVFVALAYAPLARAGFVGQDLPLLVHASRIAWPNTGDISLESSAVWPSLATSEIPPLAAASLALSSRLWSQAGVWGESAAVWLRFENLLLLLLAGWMIGRTVQRALVPWYGSEVARSASWASAMILASHPLCVAAVASPAARGDLLALAFGALSSALFMRARQDRSAARLLAASLCALLAGLSSDLALFLPFVLAVLEFASARRHRSAGSRLRTAATTFVVFAALVSVDMLLASGLGVVRAPVRLFDSLTALASPDRAFAVIGNAVEKLGVLMLPVPPGIDRAVGYSIAGALALLALQPALVAARSAPKLWGWILFAWTAAIGLALLSDSEVRVQPAELANAHVLFPAAVVMAAGFAVTSTAVSGMRRTLLPLVLGAGYAILAHAAAEAWPRAAHTLDELADDIARAQELHGRGAHVFVIDPPGRVAGLEVIGDALPLLADRSVARRGGVERFERADGEASVSGLSRAAFFALAREPEFEELCRSGVVLLLEPGDVLPAGDDASRRPSLALEPSQDSHGPELWRGEGSSPVLDLDPRRQLALRVTALPDASTAEPPRMAWRSRSKVFENGAVDGVWVAGEDGPVALFDLNRSLAWIAGKRIARIWFERSLSRIVSAEVLSDVPALASYGVPQVRGDVWVFVPPAGALPTPRHGEARWVVGLLDLGRYRYAEFSASATVPEISFTGVPAWERAILRSAGGPIVWSLEYRVGDTTLSRTSGRRQASH